MYIYRSGKKFVWKVKIFTDNLWETCHISFVMEGRLIAMDYPSIVNVS